MKHVKVPNVIAEINFNVSLTFNELSALSLINPMFLLNFESQFRQIILSYI